MKKIKKVALTLFVVVTSLHLIKAQTDYSSWPSPYKGNMESILKFTNEIEKWNPASGPLYDASNYDQVYWVKVATNFNNEKDNLIKRDYDDYSKGEAAHPITRATFAAIDKLQNTIAKKGGPGKLYKPNESALYWIERIDGITKQINSWDGVSPLAEEPARFVKGALDKTERTKITENDAYNIGLHYDLVNAAFDRLAKAVEKKGGKNMLEGAGAPIDPVLKYVLDEISENIKTINEFDPKTQRWTADYNWVWRAVSPKDRESWATDFFKGYADQKPRFYKELDKLAVAYSKKVALLTPTDNLFANHNAADEALMKKQISVKTIYKIGIEYANWEIEKNSLDIPVRRFKRAYIWGDPMDDSKYCRLYQVNLIQEYAGGGTYNATYSKYLNSWPRTCMGK
jgi:hypothetical protein